VIKRSAKYYFIWKTQYIALAPDGRGRNSPRFFTADDALDLFWNGTESPTCVLCRSWRGALQRDPENASGRNGLQLPAGNMPLP